MSSTRFNHDVLSATLDWIDGQLDSALTVESIAGQAGLSPYYFSRLFTARTGTGVMAYVRHRRLQRSARRLAIEPGVSLIDLAFDCGFESQEAFSRAFHRQFGCPPGRYRSLVPTSLTDRHDPMTATPLSSGVGVTQLEGTVHLQAFHVAGVSRRFDAANKSDIPQCWSRLVAALPFDGQVASPTLYGVVSSADRRSGSFDYMAGVEVRPQASLPNGFEQVTIAEADYLAFRITLDGTAVHPQVKAAMSRIWTELIPSSGFTVQEGPDFEIYDGRIAPTTAGAIIDFHVPVVI